MFSRVWKYLIGFTILCVIQFVCNWVVRFFDIAFPSPILGIIVLVALLKANFIKREWVSDICELLLKYMPLLFIPLAVGIVAHYGMLKENLALIIINVIGTAVATLVVTALFVENVIKFVRLRRIRRSDND